MAELADTSAVAESHAEPDVMSDIAAHNERIDAELERTVGGSPLAVGGEETPAAAEPLDEGKAPEKPISNLKSEISEEEKSEGSQSEKETETALEPIKFETSMSLEGFREASAKLLESYQFPDEEARKPLEEAFQAYEAKLEAISENNYEPLGGMERAKKVIGAFDTMYETAVEGPQGSEKIVPNTKPVIDMLRETYERELPALAAEMLKSDSFKYPGASLFQEVLMDEFGATPAQVQSVYNYLAHQVNLPVLANNVPLPTGVSEDLREAYFDISERRRYAITSISNEIATVTREIAQKEAELPNLEDYYKDDARATVVTLKANLAEANLKLNDEVTDLQKLQNGINQTRQQEEIAKRQHEQAVAKFNADLTAEYYAEVFDIAEKFIALVAPKLDFVEGPMQEIIARSLVARIANATSFLYDAEYNYVADPTAAIYAKQFQKEGIKFDFGKAGHLLHDYLVETRRIKILKSTNQSPNAIANAEQKKAKVIKEIKADQNELLGQLTSKLIKSASDALTKKVDNAKAATKQDARRVITYNGGGGQAPKTDTPKTIGDEIKLHNAKVDAEAAESGYSDVLFGRM